MRILCSAKDSHIFSTKNNSAKDSHIFSTKNNSVFVIFMLEMFNESLTNDIVNFEQLGPDLNLVFNKRHGVE